MEHVGPFGFNGVRFALGCAVLLPLVLRHTNDHGRPAWRASNLGGGIIAGLALFAGASFQQVGIVYTTAGNAGFITGLYVILVPVLGVFLGQRTHAGTWIGAVLAAAGMYLLSVTESLSISRGDVLVLISALFWAVHVHLIGYLSPRGDAFAISAVQYAVCSVLSCSVAVLTEDGTWENYRRAWIPILYGGVMSVGVAYTLQVIAQKRARPSHASIILCMEAVFAALGGLLLLGEALTRRSLAGCALMLAGMVISQLSMPAPSEPAGGCTGHESGPSPAPSVKSSI